MNRDYNILIIDDKEEMCLSLCELLEKQGYSCQYSINPSAVDELISTNDFDLIISDVKMPKIGGLDLLKEIKKKRSTIDVIMITGFPTIGNAIKAMKYGAVNFYIKPLEIEKLKSEINQLYINKPKKINSERLSDNVIVTDDDNMKKILRICDKVAPTNAPILITGESGTGKERIADNIYTGSTRQKKSFIKINCAAIAEHLLESELLGHEKGAFTNAIEQKKGKFELANEGTIFLDEIGDMSLKTQAKILRVLQEQEFERVGGTKTIKVDVRILAATNKNIKELIKTGDFREDLYYRLSVISIHLPPLRRRHGDVQILLNHFLNYFNNVYHKDILGFSIESTEVLKLHDWPGNIRELRNCMERAVIFCETDYIQTEDLPSQYLDYNNFGEQPNVNSLMDSFQKEIISKALYDNQGVKQKAAEALNINRKTLYNRMKKLGI